MTTTEPPTPTFTIPKTCKAGLVINEGPDFHIEVRDVEVPTPKEHEVLIKLNATGLCLSDIHMMTADWGTPKMSVLGSSCAGHEGAGVIVAVGSRVTRLKVGMRAGYKPLLDVCHACEACLSGRDNYCKSRIFTGLRVDGSYKQYVTSPERYTTLIPSGVSDYIAGPIMCAGSTAYGAIKDSGLRPGQWAVFLGGGGGVGSQGVQLAVAMGLRVVVVDTGKERRELCDRLGVEGFVDFKECEDAVGEVVRLTEGGAHAVYVTAVQSYPLALGYLGARVGGQVMCIGLPSAGKFQIDVNPSRLITTGQSIKGTMCSSMLETDECLDFARRGLLKIEPTIVGLSKFNESVQKLKNGEVAGRIVVDFNKP